MTIVEVANSWVGKEFRPGVTEQCMNFVRAVLEKAGHPLAEKVTEQPVDGNWTGIQLASSLAGRDLGVVVDKVEDLVAPAMLFWNDTYDVPGFGPGTITHVGIYVGNGEFVHRPTAARPVEKARLEGFWLRQFRCGLLVKDVAKPQKVSVPKAPPKLKLFFSKGKLNLVATERITLEAGKVVPVAFLSSELTLGKE